MVRVGNLEKGRVRMIREASALLDNTYRSIDGDRVRHLSYAIMNLTLAPTCSISAGAMRAPSPVAITSSRGRDASGCFDRRLLRGAVLRVLCQLRQGFFQKCTRAYVKVDGEVSITKVAPIFTGLGHQA